MMMLRLLNSSRFVRWRKSSALQHDEDDVAAEEPVEGRDQELHQHEVVPQFARRPRVDGDFPDVAVRGVPDRLGVDEDIKAPAQVVAPEEAHHDKEDRVAADQRADDPRCGAVERV
jgi:hypothetical protein